MMPPKVRIKAGTAARPREMRQPQLQQARERSREQGPGGCQRSSTGAEQEQQEGGLGHTAGQGAWAMLAACAGCSGRLALFER